ncbi:XRE family transcriptional regulator [Rhizorhapis sp. SPR117]|nr:XRE family transcriptional regulator [Rhizorhapis sp. SPR117]
MLALARDARGLTQTELVAALKGSISQAKLSKIENGLLSPTDEDVAALARVLNYEVQFFFHAHTRRSEPVTYHRKRKKLAKKDWSQIYAKAEMHRIMASLMLRSVELAPRLPLPPSIDPDEYDGRVEDIAQAVRQAWSVPRGPIEDVVSLMENAGIIVVGFDFRTELCDGFTQHATDGIPPIVFINTRQPKDRLRYSLAHELGHIVMHRLPNADMESQANRFASELLMPTSDILKDLYNLSLDRFMALKVHWKTSMQALIRKAYNAGKLNDARYRYFMVQMGKRGWRTNEPVELTNVRERPRVLMRILHAHLGKLEYTLEDMSALTGVRSAEIETMYDLVEAPKLRLII